MSSPPPSHPVDAAAGVEGDAPPPRALEPGSPAANPILNALHAAGAAVGLMHKVRIGAAGWRPLRRPGPPSRCCLAPTARPRRAKPAPCPHATPLEQPRSEAVTELGQAAHLAAEAKGPAGAAAALAARAKAAGEAAEAAARDVRLAHDAAVKV